MTTSLLITNHHIAALSAIERGENRELPPMMRKYLVRHRLIVATDPPRPPRYTPGRQRAPAPRRHQLTDLGRQVLAEHAAAQAGATA